VNVVLNPVAAFVNVSSASTMAAPDWSVTVPPRFALLLCALKGMANTRRQGTRNEQKRILDWIALAIMAVTSPTLVWPTVFVLHVGRVNFAARAAETLS
jgi:hypothetical protein